MYEFLKALGRLIVTILVCGLVFFFNARLRPSLAKPDPRPECQSIPTLTPTLVPATPAPPPPPTATPIFIPPPGGPDPTLPSANPTPTPAPVGPGPTSEPGPSPTPWPGMMLTPPPTITSLAVAPTGVEPSREPNTPAATGSYAGPLTSLATATLAPPGARLPELAPGRCEPCSPWPAVGVLAAILLLVLTALLLIWRWRRSG